MKDQGCDGVILGCTEIPLLVADDAIGIAGRLVQQAPELDRNKLVLAALHGMSGDGGKARALVDDLMTANPTLTLRTMRPFQFGDGAMAQRYARSLAAAGVPEE